jgi:hypothetical protein
MRVAVSGRLGHGSVMLDDATFDDGRGRLPDKLCIRVPRGFRHRLHEAARAERLPAGELVRRAVEARLTGPARPDDEPGPFSPGAGMRQAA